MVRHIILWQLKDEYSEERKQEIRRGMKAVSYTHLRAHETA